MPKKPYPPAAIMATDTATLTATDLVKGDRSTSRQNCFLDSRGIEKRFLEPNPRNCGNRGVTNSTGTKTMRPSGFLIARDQKEPQPPTDCIPPPNTPHPYGLKSYRLEFHPDRHGITRIVEFLAKDLVYAWELIEGDTSIREVDVWEDENFICRVRHAPPERGPSKTRYPGSEGGSGRHGVGHV